MNLSAQTWFKFLGSITLVTVATYCVLHSHYPCKDGWLNPHNKKLEFLSGENLLVLNEMVSRKDGSLAALPPGKNSPKSANTSSPAPSNTVANSAGQPTPNAQAQDTAQTNGRDRMVRKQIETYITNLFPYIDPDDKSALRDDIANLDLRYVKEILGSRPIKSESYFWLGLNWVYFELTFWSIFGVLANLLYHNGEQIRKNNFSSSEIPAQISKIIYTPFCVLIIYITYNTINSDGEIYDIKYGLYSIAIAFLLGFFSGRTLELLDRLKEALLPGKASDEKKVEKDTPKNLQPDVPPVG